MCEKVSNAIAGGSQITKLFYTLRAGHCFFAPTSVTLTPHLYLQSPFPARCAGPHWPIVAEARFGISSARPLNCSLYHNICE